MKKNREASGTWAKSLFPCTRLPSPISPGQVAKCRVAAPQVTNHQLPSTGQRSFTPRALGEEPDLGFTSKPQLYGPRLDVLHLLHMNL